MSQLTDDIASIKSMLQMLELDLKRDKTSEALDTLEGIHSYVCGALNSAGRRTTSIYTEDNGKKFK